MKHCAKSSEVIINMAKYYRKYKKIRKRRSPLKAILQSQFFLFTFLSFFLIFGLFYLFVLSPVFSIQEIKVEGNLHFVSKEEIKEYIHAAVGNNFLKSKSLFCFSKKALSHSLLQNFPAIYEIKIKRVLPHILLVQIQERDPVARFCKEEKCFLMDKEGVIFYPATSNNLVIFKKEKAEIQIGKEAVNKELLGKMLTILNVLKEELTIETQEVFLAPLEIKIHTKDGPILILAPQKDLKNQIEDLEVLVEKQIGKENLGEIEYIDLRFDKIFYKARERKE